MDKSQEMVGGRWGRRVSLSQFETATLALYHRPCSVHTDPLLASQLLCTERKDIQTNELDYSGTANRALHWRCAAYRDSDLLPCIPPFSWRHGGSLSKITQSLLTLRGSSKDGSYVHFHLLNIKS